jgi:hypothetical protein
MTEDELEKDEKEYGEMHQMGAKGILFVYNWTRLAKSIPFICSLILSGLVTLSMIIFFQKLIFGAIETLLEMNITIFPCLIGFTVGGYALIVGFAGVGDLKKFTEKAKNEKGSFFQLLISIFSVGIVLQFATILLTYVVNFIIKSHFHSFLFHKTESDFFLIVNCFAFLILLFISLWSLFIIPYIVINLFHFAQTNHSISYLEREQDEKDGTDSEYQIKLIEQILKTLKEKK